MAELRPLSGTTPERDTVLDPDAMIAALRLPAEARRRADSGGSLGRGAEVTKVWRLIEVEAMMSGKAPDAVLFEQVAQAVLAMANTANGQT